MIPRPLPTIYSTVNVVHVEVGYPISRDFFVALFGERGQGWHGLLTSKHTNVVAGASEASEITRISITGPVVKVGKVSLEMGNSGHVSYPSGTFTSCFGEDGEVEWELVFDKAPLSVPAGIVPKVNVLLVARDAGPVAVRLYRRTLPAPLAQDLAAPRKPRIYVAGPYTQGDREGNTWSAINAGQTVLEAGGIPFVPHLFHFWEQVWANPYETWMEMDFAWLEVCDGLIRLPGKSPGADREVARARERDLPVFDVTASYSNLDRFNIASWLKAEFGEGATPPQGKT